jgi:LacI family transcriptional regulator/LacI family repressor for deo operon, udp, cdd, tsx, nupC, and nupG
MSKSSSVTIKDIAKLLGISKSTVSRALTEHSDINAETRERVLAMAKKLDYQPNAIALNLKQQRTNTIGIIIPETVNRFFSKAVGGIQKVANLAGYNVVICQSYESYVTEKNIIKSLIASHVDGLLISVSHETDKTDHFDSLLQKNIPVVFFDRICETVNASQVFTDNYEISFEATEHLITQGCQRIAIVAGPQHLFNSRKRLEGYLGALKKNGMPIRENYIMHSDFRNENIETYTRYLINLNPRPDAVIAINDMAAIEMMHVIKKNGLKIPEDIAVLGFNNEHVSKFIEPSLSTIDLPAYDMGSAAAELLLHQIKYGNSEPQRKLIKSRLIVRESTHLIKTH